MKRVLLPAILTAVWICTPGEASAQTEPAVVHGADSVFATSGVALVWGVLRAATDDDAEVVIRISAPGYASARVEAVDPFAGSRRLLAASLPLGDRAEIRRRRGDFSALPRLEIRLEPAPGGAPRPLVVYYLGVPDTTPELTSAAALGRYLDEAIVKARGSR